MVDNSALSQQPATLPPKRVGRLCTAIRHCGLRSQALTHCCRDKLEFWLQRCGGRPARHGDVCAKLAKHIHPRSKAIILRCGAPSGDDEASGLSSTLGEPLWPALDGGALRRVNISEMLSRQAASDSSGMLLGVCDATLSKA